MYKNEFVYGYIWNPLCVITKKGPIFDKPILAEEKCIKSFRIRNWEEFFDHQNSFSITMQS
jgi:hypothetical protein